jgi:hypothetical protein
VVRSLNSYFHTYPWSLWWMSIVRMTKHRCHTVFKCSFYGPVSVLHSPILSISWVIAHHAFWVIAPVPWRNKVTPGSFASLLKGSSATARRCCPCRYHPAEDRRKAKKIDKISEFGHYSSPQMAVYWNKYPCPVELTKLFTVELPQSRLFRHKRYPQFLRMHTKMERFVFWEIRKTIPIRGHPVGIIKHLWEIKQ